MFQVTDSDVAKLVERGVAFGVHTVHRYFRRLSSESDKSGKGRAIFGACSHMEKVMAVHVFDGTNRECRLQRVRDQERIAPETFDIIVEHLILS